MNRKHSHCHGPRSGTGERPSWTGEEGESSSLDDDNEGGDHENWEHEKDYPIGTGAKFLGSPENIWEHEGGDDEESNSNTLGDEEISPVTR